MDALINMSENQNQAILLLCVQIGQMPYHTKHVCNLSILTLQRSVRYILQLYMVLIAECTSTERDMLSFCEIVTVFDVELSDDSFPQRRLF